MHGSNQKMEQTHQCAKIVPDLRDIWIKSNRAGISVQGISVLVNLVVEHTD